MKILEVENGKKRKKNYYAVGMKWCLFINLRKRVCIVYKSLKATNDTERTSESQQ